MSGTDQIRSQARRPAPPANRNEGRASTLVDGLDGSLSTEHDGGLTMRWWLRRRRDEDVEREVQAHLDCEADEQQALGATPDESRYAARRAFGNPTLVQEDTRAVWQWNTLEQA